jgi:DNA-binding FadR family transcriptional regulator
VVEIAPRVAEARQIIEARAAELAAEQERHEDIAQIRRVVDDFFRIQFDPCEQQLDRDLDFHVAVAGSQRKRGDLGAGAVLVGILREHWQQIHLPRDQWAALCSHHYEIYEAIRTRDGRAAAQRMAEHLERLRKVLEQI